MKLPDRTADTMADAIAMSSPNGRMSKRARKAAQDRLGRALFGDYDPHARREPTPEEKRAQILSYAQFLRRLAARGMAPRKYIKEAERLEAQAATL